MLKEVTETAMTNFHFVADKTTRINQLRKFFARLQNKNFSLSQRQQEQRKSDDHSFIPCA
jgi:hypothetical protein